MDIIFHINFNSYTAINGLLQEVGDVFPPYPTHLVHLGGSVSRILSMCVCMCHYTTIPSAMLIRAVVIVPQP